MGAARQRRCWNSHGARRLAGPAPAGPDSVARGPAADIRLARRGRVELSRSGRRARHFHRYDHESALLCPAKTASVSETLVASAMSFRPGQEQPPTPEQLAAFFDGELEGKDALAPLKQRIEAWLCEHPEARAEWDLYRRLAELWRATAPDEPAEEAWNAVRARLPERPAAVKSTRR